MNRKTILPVLALAGAMLTMPAAAQEETGIPVGERTLTAIGDAYIGGLEIAVTVDPLEASFPLLGEDKRAQALASLLKKCSVEMTFYDDFGTACIGMDVMLDGVQVLDADALIYEDGSMQVMTDLTGDLLFTLPAGTADGGAVMQAAYGNSEAMQRLMETLPGVGTTILQDLLGWVSSTQMDRGDLYTFDYDYLEATEMRDGVAQRMIGKIQSFDLTLLPWYLTASISDKHGEFQQALADVLAENGVTRKQMRTFTDNLITGVEMSSAEDYVEMTERVMRGPDEALCEMDDVQYFFKKLVKRAKLECDMCSEVTESDLVVSYDDFGTIVGFDANLARFSTIHPYEGTFTYSSKTDENWQTLYTAHGEMNVEDDARIVGDLQIHCGQDVGGISDSWAHAYLDRAGKSEAIGFGIDAGMKMLAQPDGGELFEGYASASARRNAQSDVFAGVTTSGSMQATEDGFELNAAAALNVPGLAEAAIDIRAVSREYDGENTFTGGKAMNLKQLSEEDIALVKENVKGNAVRLGAAFVLHPGVMSDVLTLIGE